MFTMTKFSLASIRIFVDTVRKFDNGDELLITFSPSDLSKKLINQHKNVFSWHHADTIRSYTQLLLRKRGSRGKREDFAYYNRAKKYFGYDQFEAHRKQKNKLICFWNPMQVYDNHVNISSDYTGEHNPCLVILKFKEVGKYLDMVAIFRKRDLVRRAIGNWLMLSQWLKEEAVLRKMRPRNIIDFSMEAFYKPDDLVKFKNGG